MPSILLPYVFFLMNFIIVLSGGATIRYFECSTAEIRVAALIDAIASWKSGFVYCSRIFNYNYFYLEIVLKLLTIILVYLL